MPDIKGTTRAQTIFLRGFRKSRIGPPLEDWPTPAVFRRWLRRPAFRRALDSLRDSLRYQADFQLAMSAAHGSINLSEMFLNNQAEHLIPQIFHVLDLSHRRQRFTQTQHEDLSTSDPIADHWRALSKDIAKETHLQREENARALEDL